VHFIAQSRMRGPDCLAEGVKLHGERGTVYQSRVTSSAVSYASDNNSITYRSLSGTNNIKTTTRH